MAKRMETHNKILIGCLVLAVLGAFIATIGTSTADMIGAIMIVTGMVIGGIIAFLWYGYI
jgi:hypothetical protein